MEEIVHHLLLVAVKTIIIWLMISAALAEIWNELYSISGGTPDLTLV